MLLAKLWMLDECGISGMSDMTLPLEPIADRMPIALPRPWVANDDLTGLGKWPILENEPSDDAIEPIDVVLSECVSDGSAWPARPVSSAPFELMVGSTPPWRYVVLRELRPSSL